MFYIPRIKKKMFYFVSLVGKDGHYFFPRWAFGECSIQRSLATVRSKEAFVWLTNSKRLLCRVHLYEWQGIELVVPLDRLLERGVDFDCVPCQNVWRRRVWSMNDRQEFRSHLRSHFSHKVSWRRRPHSFFLMSKIF